MPVFAAKGGLLDRIGERAVEEMVLPRQSLRDGAAARTMKRKTGMIRIAWVRIDMTALDSRIVVDRAPPTPALRPPREGVCAL